MDDPKALAILTHIAALPEPKRTNMLAFIEYMVGHAYTAQRMLESEAALVSIIVEPPLTHAPAPLN